MFKNIVINKGKNTYNFFKDNLLSQESNKDNQLNNHFTQNQSFNKNISTIQQTDRQQNLTPQKAQLNRSVSPFDVTQKINHVQKQSPFKAKKLFFHDQDDQQNQQQQDLQFNFLQQKEKLKENQNDQVKQHLNSMDIENDIRDLPQLNLSSFQSLSRRKSQVYQLWIDGDDIFSGKFKTGTTPLQLKKMNSIQQNEENQFSLISQEDSASSSSSDGKEFQNDFKLSTPTFKKKTSFLHQISTTSPQKVSKRIFDNSLNQDIQLSQNSNSIENQKSRFGQDYKIIEVIGVGNFGKVYKCLHIFDKTEYAIKATHYKFNKSFLQNQALNETRALAQLSAQVENPYIVRYYNAWIEDDQLYLVMELCVKSLFQMQMNEKFREKTLFQILRDVSIGLQQLHARNIVHLDIKPDNILYSKTNKYKIADLGLSRIAKRAVGEEIDEGDCHYMAQELLQDIFQNNQIPDLKKADIFSLGISVYEIMIQEKLPPNGDEWLQIRQRQLQKLDKLQNYSQELKDIIRQMMDPEPNKRPSADELLSMDCLKSDLELQLQQEKLQNEIHKKRIRKLENLLKKRTKKYL